MEACTSKHSARAKEKQKRVTKKRMDFLKETFFKINFGYRIRFQIEAQKYSIVTTDRIKLSTRSHSRGEITNQKSIFSASLS